MLVGELDYENMFEREELKHFSGNITLHDNKEAPEVDIHVAGFPCQSFSLAGLGKGFQVKGNRGNIFFYVMDYIRTKKAQRFYMGTCCWFGAP